ncbi:SDR family oxidoreductase [Paenibacillus sinopodophylli]|uniref:SDR family oxidoreductase n=1 Tax=Paenibacillus sinopodophylli TaxID=1837342 RepID=UPI00110D2285|nr:SDR family oxidoreductase [Paenibacillus sinopodophylli]
MSTKKETLLVTSASGQLGQLALQCLLDHYDGPIIATTRNTEKLAKFAERGVIVRQADFNQPESLLSAFVGANRLLLISTDALETRINQQRNAIQAAVQAGIKHIVYTSSMNPMPGMANWTATDHYATEEAIRESGVSYTILRNSMYTENLIQTLAHTLATDKYVAATGEGTIAYVTRKDCAIAAAAALVSSNTDNRIFNITGPEAISGHNIAQVLSEIAKKRISYVPVDATQLVGMYEYLDKAEAVPQEIVSFDPTSAKMESTQTSSAFQDLTGQAPTSLKLFLEENFWKNVTLSW